MNARDRLAVARLSGAVERLAIDTPQGLAVAKLGWLRSRDTRRAEGGFTL